MYGVNEKFGCTETNGLSDGAKYHADFRESRMVDWTEPGLRITRLRLLSDPGYPFWDVSYCHGMIGNERVSVSVPFSDLPKANRNGAIIEAAKRDGVNAKMLGVFSAISTLN
jgi:hypothetical protein